MQSFKAIARGTAAAAAAALLAGCQTGSAYRDPQARLNPDMAAVVVAYQSLGAKPVNTLTVQQARSQPTLADAARRVQGDIAAGPFVKTTDMMVDGAAGPLPARLYDATPGHASQPIILFFHGGGWVTGGIETNDLTARALASQAHAMVLSVAYRLAPEARLPAAQDDAFAAYRWLLASAASLGADPRRIAVAGESAGGALALDVAIAARDASIAPPVHSLLIDPVAGSDTHTRSAIANQDTVPLNRSDVLWYFDHAVGGADDLQDPRIDLVGHADLKGLPPTTVIAAEMDPLESGGRALTQKLQASGVEVARVEYAGTAHGFFGTGAVVARAREAEAFAAAELDASFDRIGEPPAPPASPPPSRRQARRRHS